MNDKKTLQERLEQSRIERERKALYAYFTDVLSHIPGLTFLGFEQIPAMIDPAPDDCEVISQILFYNKDEHREFNSDELVNWMIPSLREANIKGEFFLKFYNRLVDTRNPGWARVILDESYAWVKPLWSGGRELHFFTIDRTKYLGVYIEPEAQYYRVYRNQTG